MAISPPRHLDRRTAGELRLVERTARRSEDLEAWREARRAARVIHYATVAERPDIALHQAGTIVSLADRRIRQLGGDDGRAA